VRGLSQESDMISSWDDFPIHQTAEPVRFVATSDRNFYDRYYFNLHGSSDELFLIFGMGLYPNLGTQDAFAVVRRGPHHRVVRASRELTDRRDTCVGPFRLEVLEPLRKLRCVLEPTEHAIAFDLTWEGAIPAWQEPRHFVRRHGRVLFDTSRFAQLGRWSGTLSVAGEQVRITPDRWWGSRDRSWGVRPVGEPEHAGIRQGEGAMSGMWNYFPMQFDDHAILYICQETSAGERELEEGVRVWADPQRPPDHLGRPEWRHELAQGTRLLRGSTIAFPDAPGGRLEVRCTPLLPCMVSVGTGYGMDADWRHGMYQGALVVQGLDKKHDEVVSLGQYGVVDQVARFEYGGRVGYGLYEHGFFGAFEKCGLVGAGGVAT
jgi:hypothetical protein